MNADPGNKDLIAQLARRSKKVLLISAFLSVFFHLLSYINLSYVARVGKDQLALHENQPVKIRIVDTKKEPKKDKDQTRPDEVSRKQIVEAVLNKTEKPDDARLSSFQDHKTERETRVEVTNQEKAKNAGPKGMEKEIKPGSKPQEEVVDKSQPKLNFGPGGTLAIQSGDAERRKKRARYQKLMPKQADLAGVIDAGYQQHLDESIDLGESIDINTSEYRFMGYFTAMRKSIELVWNYPMEAVRRGMQGEVGIEFVIHKEGNISRVTVYKSSGYKILDDAIVEAVKLASPFAPLPKGFGKDKMKVYGGYRYILSPTMAGH